MGDLANMTDNDGRLNGHRLLVWLRSRAEMERTSAQEGRALWESTWAAVHNGRAGAYEEMADDLERELTPPDYPADDCAGVWANVRGCEDRYTTTGKSPDGPRQDDVDLSSLAAQGLAACPGCGAMWGCEQCSRTLNLERPCAGRDDEDGIDLDTLPAPGREADHSQRGSGV